MIVLLVVCKIGVLENEVELLYGCIIVVKELVFKVYFSYEFIVVGDWMLLVVIEVLIDE